MKLQELCCLLLGTLLPAITLGASDGRQRIGIAQANSTLQDIVQWDQYSMIIRGERMFIFSGEFHPWRLPSPGLWLDIFQKIKAMGFNAVSFYTYWGLVEGTPGDVRFEGVFALEEFFRAASEAGIYLIARPGPYINAEVAVGGMPGWLLRMKSPLRGNSTEYLKATDAYTAKVGEIIAKAQITNGGPVVMLQVENEYDTWPGTADENFPLQLNREEMAYTQRKFREAGIVVPTMHNDHLNQGNWAPGTGLGEVDLYGIDAYPMRYDCGHPDVWPTYRFPTDWHLSHKANSPNTPFFIAEFQGGVSTGFGTTDQDQCNGLVNQESVRVLWKNNYSFATKVFNVYMAYGGTNWGNLGYTGGDTSYDYGAAIKETRHVWREKYSEQKLQANFFKVSPGYLTAVAGNASNGTYTSTKDITATPVFGTNHPSNFYIVRHADFTTKENMNYNLQVPTSSGTLSIPLLGGELTLFGRDSKIHVTDYDVGGVNLVYSTAEIFTWGRDSRGERVLVLYGGAGELHEWAVDIRTIASYTGLKQSCNGTKSTLKSSLLNPDLLVVQWQVTHTRQTVRLGDDLEVHMLWRNDAYNYWVLELPAALPTGNYSSPSKSSVVVKAGYLLRTASIEGETLRLTGDINSTTDLELIFDPTNEVKSLTFNGTPQPLEIGSSGKLSTTLHYLSPDFRLPDFAAHEWKYLDTLPEIQPGYDDSLWTTCDHTTTNNTEALKTPTSLYASDYGYHAGSLIYRGHFTANGNEQRVFLRTAGGYGFAFSVWLNSTFVKSWGGGPPAQRNATFIDTISLSHISLVPGEQYVFTVLIDHLGQDEEAPGTDAVKSPMGLLDYNLGAHEKSDVTWKMTGNLGGEEYVDKVRGPRNEGALYAERQGYHQPSPSNKSWKLSSPVTEGIPEAGVGFYTTEFDLHIPEGYDVPLSFVFKNDTLTPASFRVQLWVNGYQFGKYIANLGPQSKYPVPEGVLNHNGTNTVAISLWSLSGKGARLPGLALEAEMPLMSGYRKPWLVPMPSWEPRKGAY